MGINFFQECTMETTIELLWVFFHALLFVSKELLVSFENMKKSYKLSK